MIAFPLLDEVECPILEQPALLQGIRLKPFQVAGFSWMVSKETEIGGGILADDMGMGKTVQTLALMLEKRCRTLIVVPASVTKQWCEAVEAHAPSLGNVLLHHGHTKQSHGKLERADVVITTYDTIKALTPPHECSKCRRVISRSLFSEHHCVTEYHKILWNLGRTRKDGPRLQLRSIPDGTRNLLTIPFGRVVLDEAHLIKQSNTKRAIACRLLNAEYRWCLSGTPFQNKLGEISSLLRFLRYDVGDVCTCRNAACDYKCLNRRMNQQLGCENGLAFMADIFRDIMLRRMKEDFLDMPNLNQRVVSVRMPHAEMEIYTEVERQCQLECIELWTDQNRTEPIPYLVYLMRMRQCAASSQLMFPLRIDAEQFCCCCLTDIRRSDAVDIFFCGHVSHSSCISEKTGGGWCPDCLGEAVGYRKGVPRRLSVSWGRSAKIDAIAGELCRSDRDCNDRTLVFSCFCQVMYLVVAALADN